MSARRPHAEGRVKDGRKGAAALISQSGGLAMRRWILGLALGLVWLTFGLGAGSAKAQGPDIGRFYYYPYYYFPHNYWPQMGPEWPERTGMPYMRPPAYMAYPAFTEPHWRHELFYPQKYY